jgi:hypothetical protein
MASDLTTLMEYERGELDTRGTLLMFADMVADGSINTMPDHLEQKAKNFIRNGYITECGEVTIEGWHLIDNMESE